MAKVPTSPKSAFWLGYRDTIPFWLIIVPFALLFGAVATEAGLSVVEAMSMTILVIAGASQFTALSLLQENAPTIVIVVASLAVNLRMAMYSAALVPHLGAERLGLRALYGYFMVDQSFALAINKFNEAPEMSVRIKGMYYSGCFFCLCPVWYVFSMRSLPHFVAAIVSIIGALLLVNIPYSLGLLIAAVFAMMAGAQTELWLERRNANA